MLPPVPTGDLRTPDLRAATVSILDVAPAIRALLGIESSQDIDGQVAEDLLMSRPNVTVQAGAAPKSDDQRAYGEEEEEKSSSA